MTDEHSNASIPGAQGGDERRAARSNVILRATVDQNGERIPVRISNLSADGALVIGDRLSTSEVPVILHCNGLAIESFVVWSRDRHAGLEFTTTIQPEVLCMRISPSFAITRDKRNVDYRRPGFRGNQMTDEEREFFNEMMRSAAEEPDVGSSDADD